MNKTKATATFFERVKVLGPTPAVEQWGSLTTCSQYRVAYAKTFRYVKEDAICLDWGSGNGHFSYFLTQSGFSTNAYAFDVPPAFVASNPLFRFTRGTSDDPVTLPYPSNRFDAVYSMGVLEHVHESGGDQQKSMREVERIVRPGGVFLIFHLPNQWSWIELLVRLLKHVTSSQKHAHSKLFTRKSFVALLKGTSFEILERGRYNIIPRNSFNRLPKFLTNQRWFCRMIDLIDDIGAAILPLFAQNWFFILRKKN